MKYSDTLAQFLSFLRQCQKDFDYHYDRVNKKDKETQDLLHQIELGKTYQDRAKALPVLHKVRKERRESKDTVKVTTYIADFVSENSKTIRELEKLLGEIRKVEKCLKNREYKARIRKDLTI